jgi:hypothetical protein
MVEMSHAAGMMWGLVAFWCWLSWRRNRREGWAILVGIAAGFYAITRPLDAICVLAPIAMVWAWELRGLSWRAAARTALLAAAGAAPLLITQLAFDRAVTGHALEAPLDRYNRMYFNARSIGLQRIDPTFHPPTPAPPLQKLYLEYDLPRMQEFSSPKRAAWNWITYRVPLTIGAATPSLYLVILLPVAVLGLMDARRWVFWSMSWCFLIGAGFFYIFVPQYTITAAPAILFAVVLAVSVIQRAWPGASLGAVFVPLCALFLALEYIALNQQNFFEPIPAGGPSSPGWVSRYNYDRIPAVVKKPALVFFHFGPDENAWEEPVYNWDVLNPDDAPIIRVHDLGPARNLELLRYYAKRQPDRHVYLFHRQSLQLDDLGKVSEAVESRTSGALRRSAQ